MAGAAAPPLLASPAVNPGVSPGNPSPARAAAWAAAAAAGGGGATGSSAAAIGDVELPLLLSSCRFCSSCEVAVALSSSSSSSASADFVAGPPLSDERLDFKILHGKIKFVFNVSKSLKEDL